MMNFKRYFTLALCVPLCLSMYACSGVPSGTTSSTSSGIAVSAEQDEINAAFEEAVEKLKATTYRKGTDEVEVSDPSMWSDEFFNTFGGTCEKIAKSNGYYEHIYDIKKNDTGKATDYKITKSIDNIHHTLTDGTSATVVTYSPGDGSVYAAGTKSPFKTTYKSNAYQYSYLMLRHLSSLKSTINGSISTFDFEIGKAPAFQEFTQDYAALNSNTEIKYFGGRLIVDSSTGKITLELKIEIENTETGHTFTKTHKSVCDNTTPELEFPDDLDSYDIHSLPASLYAI